MTYALTHALTADLAAAVDRPAGGAPLMQIVAAAAMSLIVFVPLLVTVIRERQHKVTALGRVADLSSPWPGMGTQESRGMEMNWTGSRSPVIRISMMTSDPAVRGPGSSACGSAKPGRNGNGSLSRAGREMVSEGGGAAAGRVRHDRAA